MAPLLLKLLSIGSISALCLACSDDTHSADDENDDGPNAELADVVFVNEISDEALVHLLEKTPVDEASQRLEFRTPPDGAVLDRAAAATFSWRLAESAASESPVRRPGGSRWRHIASELESFLSPIGVAHAHGPTYNGTAYFLAFSTAMNAELLRVFTAEKSYTPDPESWDTLVEARAPITLDITSAFFENSLLASDGGPFVGASVQFTID